MRILFLTTTFTRFEGDPLGGIGNCFYDLFSELSKLAQVDVVAPLSPGSLRYEKRGNLTIYREPPIKNYGSLASMLKTTQAFKIPLMLINMYLKARSLSRKNNYDVVHGFFVVPSGFLISMLPGRSKKIISALGSDVHTLSYKPLMSSLYCFIFSKTDGAIYNTQSMKQRLETLQAKNLKYIPTPFNSKSFKLSPILPKSPSFLFVGRLTKEKGVEILLKGFKKVVTVLPTANLTIIGDGPEKKWMENFILKNGLSESVQLTGTLSRKEIFRYMKNSRCLLLPSFGEGTPASVLEAMSVGRPIVATKVGGLQNLIDNKAGFLINIGDVDQFAQAMIKVCKKNFDPQIISNKVQKFDAKFIAKEYFDYYNKIKKFRN